MATQIIPGFPSDIYPFKFSDDVMMKGENDATNEKLNNLSTRPTLTLPTTIIDFKVTRFCVVRIFLCTRTLKYSTSIFLPSYLMQVISVKIS